MLINSKTKIKIAVDARDLNRPILRGQGRYLLEIINRMVFDFDVEWHLISDRPDLPFHLNSSPNVKIHIFDMKGYRFHFWEQIGLPIMAKRLRADCLFCPGIRVPIIQGQKNIVTIHDVMPWLSDEENWQKGFYKDVIIPKAFSSVEKIITVSKKSKSDIVSLWPRLEKKISVIPNGISEIYLEHDNSPLPSELVQHGVKKKYFLYIGGGAERKRLFWAMKIFKQIENEDCHLVLCGVDQKKYETSALKYCKNKIDKIVCLPFVEDKHMPFLYQNAEAVLYPTLYEGFGFPILEAHSVGTPILYSPVGSLEELKGPSSIVLPVDELDEWINACKKILSNNILHNFTMSTAKEWAKAYSWKKNAKMHAKIFMEVLN